MSEPCRIIYVNNRISENKRLGPMIGGITRWRFPRSNGALTPARNCREKIGLISGCLWSLSQTPFSLPNKHEEQPGLKKLWCSSRKPGGNDWDKTSVVIQVYSICWYLEGLSFLMRSHLTGMPRRACFVFTSPLPLSFRRGEQLRKNRVGMDEQCS